MTKDVVQFLTAQYGKLSSSEKTVADYLITHFHEAIRMSVHELAAKAGVSAATPVRLAQRMGFQGYKDFRLHLAQRQPEHEDLILDIKQTTDSVAETAEKVLHAEMETLRLTLQELDIKTLEEIAERIKTAKQLLFFGTGTSLLVCRDAASKFRRTGKVVHCTDDPYEAASLLASFDNQDMIVCVSHSGENAATLKTMRLAKARNLYRVAVTTFADSTLCREADRILYTQTRESPLHKIALTSRISQLAMTDVLFMAYLTTDYAACEQNLSAVSHNLKQVGLIE